MAYKTIDNNDLEYLKSIVNPKRVFVGEEINEDYEHDEMNGISGRPDVLIKVTSTEEVSAIMKYANENLIPVVCRGSGSGLVGAAVAINGGIMIETTLMNNILELDEENLTVTVEPGVLLMNLAEFVECKGYFYPPDPGEKLATIGGNISTNAGGMRAVKYGVTRDYVRGLTVVLPNGEVIELGGKVVKNSTGYSLKDLIIGSEGTLGIITKAVLKLLPLPEHSVSLLLPYDNMEDALSTVPEIIKAKIIPTAIEYFNRDSVLFAEQYLRKKFPDNSSEAYLLLSFDGNHMDIIEQELEKVAEMCLERGAIDALLIDTEERKNTVWSTRGAFLEAIKASTTEMDECDVVVPRNKVADFIKYTQKVSEENKLRIPYFGHAGDGNLHLYLCRDDLDQETWEQLYNKCFDLLYEYAGSIGGFISGEHGIGYAKKKYMKKQLGNIQTNLMFNIKQVFDPNNILNPGKVCQ